MARCIFHIDLDAFFVSVEQVLNPQLKGKPVIVDVVARKGRTLIELVEEHGSESVYAIVVMTGDDIGYLKGNEADKKPRTRQNVVFELEFFYGKLGR